MTSLKPLIAVSGVLSSCEAFAKKLAADFFAVFHRGDIGQHDYRHAAVQTTYRREIYVVRRRREFKDLVYALVHGVGNRGNKLFVCGKDGVV